MKAKIIAFGLVFVLLLSVTVGMASALSNSGGGDWKYYKQITIKENSGKKLTDFQVLVELNPSNFPTNAKSDGSDLRFEDASGKELNYWIDDWDYSAKEAKIWVKVPSIPANGETKIEMYYGNPSAGAVSDGDTVFEFFDDFEGASLDLNKWNIVGPSNRLHISNSVLTVDIYDSTDPIKIENGIIAKDYVLNPKHIIVARTKDPYSQINAHALYVGVANQAVVAFWRDPYNVIGMTIYQNNNPIEDFILDSKETTRRHIGHCWSGFTEWHTYRIAYIDDSTAEFYRDYDLIDTISGDVYIPNHNSDIYPVLGGNDYSNVHNEMRYDWIFVAKYASPKPTLNLSAEIPTTKPTPTAPILVPAGEEKGISGFGAINSLRIEVQENGDADFSAQYSLSWWEQFYLWIKEALGDRDATKNLIESKIESNLERKVESLRISESGDASFILKDYVGKVDREEGTWYWTKFYLKDEDCEKINLGTVYVIFPDGFIYEFDGKLPNIKHLENENLAKLYLEAKITKGIYEAIYCQYEASQIGKVAGDFITKIDMTLINMIATSPIPYSEFGSLVSLAKDFKTDMGEYNKILDNAMVASHAWGEIRGHKIGFSNNVKNMAELKEEEISLIYSIISNDEISYESRESLKQKLIDNLESQKELIPKMKGSAYDVVSISETDSSNVKEIKAYFSKILKNTRKLADTDLKYVEQGLTALKKGK